MTQDDRENKDEKAPAESPEPAPPWWKEITQPFVDLLHAPRALWGVNLGYFIEGMVYFGILTYLAKHFSDFIFQGVPQADIWSHNMVAVLTAGITIAMLFLGGLADKWGIRKALLVSFVALLIGRFILASAPVFFEPAGLWSPLHLMTMLAILVVVVGYGVYQPAAYAAIRKVMNSKNSGMGYAMLYALMNLGSWLCSFTFLLRDEDYLNLGIPGTFWVFTALTAVSLLITITFLSKKTVDRAMAKAAAESAVLKEQEESKRTEQETADHKAAQAADAVLKTSVPIHVWFAWAAIIAVAWWRVPTPYNYAVMGVLALVPAVILMLPGATRARTLGAIANHPLANSRFFFFIFALIPVQTLFTYNWFILPQYISRAYEGFIGEYFEVAANANPLLIFVLTPMIAAMTQKYSVYKMMIWGTLIMGSAPFFLAIGATPTLLGVYIVVMSIGEAMWSPRFLQYAAEIAPEGRTGVYMGVSQFPWFLTKIFVPLLYSGTMMDRYCPADGPRDTETMWLIFGGISIITPIALLMAAKWVAKGKGMKAKA